jgi:hypothetical protein
MNRLSERSRVDGLLDLIHRYPATMATWLARVAGIAYDAHNFWTNFCRALELNIPLNRREELASRFRRVCQNVMSGFVEAEIGSWRLAGQFLFQAGLPLCHCDRFTRATRGVAQNFGLPDPDDLEAVEEFRSELLGRTEVQQSAVVQTALAAASGQYLLQAALRAVREDDYDAINPALGGRLRAEFANSISGRGVAVLHAPYIRLSEACTSFEIVGPVQPDETVGGTGLAWCVNGQLHCVSRHDEFVFSADHEPTLVVELRGLRNGRQLQREFSVDVSSASPFLVFAVSDRKQKRVATDGNRCSLPCGDYWIVHRASDILDDAESVFNWEDGERATSLLKLRPGNKAVLRGGDDSSICDFAPTVTPFLEIQGQSLLTDDGIRVQYGWQQIPTVWIPRDDADSLWFLRADFNGTQHEWSLVPDVTGALGDLLPCRVANANFLSGLAPAFYEVRFEIVRRTRRQIVQTALYWHGLQSATPQEFQFSKLPVNVEENQCAGFEITRTSFRHCADRVRQHRLAFNVGDKTLDLCWSQPGVFLESVLKVPNAPARIEEHALGETFSADTYSRKFLRVWIVPSSVGELRVRKALLHKFDARCDSKHVDISLAHLATLFPEGGEIVLLREGVAVTVARFRRPVTPSIFEYTADAEYEGLLFKFPEPVRSVRPHFRELVSGREIRFEGQAFSTAGHCLFHNDGVPQFQCANICDGQNEAMLHRVALDIPKTGWPTGIWLGEIEVKRDDQGEWEPIRDPQGGHFPLLLLRTPEIPPADYRGRCFWWAFGRTTNSGVFGALPSSAGNEKALILLLQEIGDMLKRGFSAESWLRIRALETLYFELSRQAAWLLDNTPELVVHDLAAAFARDANPGKPRSLVASIPALLALPGDICAFSEATDALRGSLAWCGTLATASSVCDGLAEIRVVDAIGPSGRTELPGTVFRFFSNFRTAVSAGGDGEFFGFNYRAHFDFVRAMLATLPTDGGWSTVEPLSAPHLRWALTQFSERRARSGGDWAAQANSVFHHAHELRRQLREGLIRYGALMPEAIWSAPWIDIEVSDDDLMTNANRFASVLALAARASGVNWMRFGSVIQDLRRKFGVETVGKALTTLICQGPELLGYYLMFWELMIRTYPHD